MFKYGNSNCCALKHGRLDLIKRELACQVFLWVHWQRIYALKRIGDAIRFRLEYSHPRIGLRKKNRRIRHFLTVQPWVAARFSIIPCPFPRAWSIGNHNGHGCLRKVTDGQTDVNQAGLKDVRNLLQKDIRQRIACCFVVKIVAA